MVSEVLVRRVASYWRIISVPVFAEFSQWMLRTSSPGAYSRRPWKSRSSSTISLLGWPSRSRGTPALSVFSATVRGWMNTVICSVSRLSRRTKPNGSLLQMDRGPMGRMSRDTAVNSTVVMRDWPAASMGMVKRSWSSPMGRSPRAEAVGVRPGLSTHTLTATLSDTVTRRRDTSMVALKVVLPSDSTTAHIIMAVNATAMASSSCHPSIRNAVAEMMARAMTVHPGTEIYEVSSRLARCLMRRRVRTVAVLRRMVCDCCIP